MKRFVLTFLSTAAVCAVVYATPAAAQDTITGAPAGNIPVTADGYGNFSGYMNPFAPVFSAANSAPAYGSERCHVIRDSYGSYGRLTSVCGP
jgi:hypothetical protein